MYFWNRTTCFGHDLYPLLCVECQTPDDGQRNSPKHVESYSKNEFEKLMLLVGFIIRKISLPSIMHLNAICWEGIRRFHQAVKGVNGTKKKLVRTPDFKSNEPLRLALIIRSCAFRIFGSARILSPVAVCSFETSVNLYQTTCLHIPEDRVFTVTSERDSNLKCLFPPNRSPRPISRPGIARISQLV